MSAMSSLTYNLFVVATLELIKAILFKSPIARAVLTEWEVGTIKFDPNNVPSNSGQMY